MKKRKFMLFSTMLIVGSMLGNTSVEASSVACYYKSRIANNYHYEFSVSETTKTNSLKLMDILYHTKDADSESLSIEKGKTLNSTATKKIGSAVSATVGAEYKALGFKAKADVSASVSSEMAVENSVSTTYKKGYTSTIKKSNKKGWYALEAITYGKKLDYKFVKENISSAKGNKTKKITVVYTPTEGMIPVKRTKWYSSNPQLKGIYTNY